MSRGEKIAIGVAAGAVAVGVVTVGAVGLGTAAYLLHNSHEEKHQMASPLRLTARVICAENLVGKDTHLFHHSNVALPLSFTS